MGRTASQPHEHTIGASHQNRVRTIRPSFTNSRMQLMLLWADPSARHSDPANTPGGRTFAGKGRGGALAPGPAPIADRGGQPECPIFCEFTKYIDMRGNALVVIDYYLSGRLQDAQGCNPSTFLPTSGGH